MTKPLLTLCLLATSWQAAAQIASDTAANYGGVWSNGNNGGSGFLPWSITSNNNGTSIFAGTFIGNSTDGAGNINTGGVSFGLYANPVAASVDADRAFAVSLANGNVFSFQMALNFDNGNKGFNLYAGGQGEVFNFNVGSGGSVSSANATLLPGSGAGYNYGGNNAVIDVSITVTSASTFGYAISRTSESGFQGTLFSGSVSGLTNSLSGFRFYVSGTDNGSSQNNLYVNSLTVVPEPSTWALLVLGALSIPLVRRRFLSNQTPETIEITKQHP